MSWYFFDQYQQLRCANNRISFGRHAKNIFFIIKKSVGIFSQRLTPMIQNCVTTAVHHIKRRAKPKHKTGSDRR